jgi:type II secretory pathway component GspD/PulD (secretin)
MFRALFQPALAALLAALLACPALPAQDTKKDARKSSQTPSDSMDLVKPDPKQAKKLVELGDKFAAEGARERALDAYDEAARYAPFDVTIVNKAAVLRGQLVREYADAAEKFAAEGNFQDATVQLAAALRLDPNNAAVLQRMQKLASMSEQKSLRLPDLPPEGLPKVEPQKVSKDFNLHTDLRSAYEQAAAAYGIKASFDPDLPARDVRLRLENANFDTAMKVLAAETGTFWRALSPNLIFVAANTAEKRKAYDPQLEQTFVLPSSVDAQEITEIVRAIRDLTGAQHIQQSVSNHTLTIRDTAEHVRLAGAILHEVEQARGEVLLEIDLLEVDRNKARNLGITPPANLHLYSVPPTLGSALRSAPSITALLTLLTQIFGTAASGGLTSLASAIPPIASIGGGKTTFLLGLPSVTANFSDALTLVRSGRQVLLRAQDGKPATFFVGDRYPITLSLLSGSLGGGSAASFSGNPGGTPISIPTEQFTVGAGPVALVAADFRSIGTQDLAVLNELDNTITIFLNQGTGAVSQFAQATGSPITLGPPRATTPTIPAAIASGNLNPLVTPNNPNPNGDNFPDLLVTDPIANNVTVLLQTPTGDGTFLTPKTPITVGKQPSAIVTGTFNSNSNSNVGFVVTNFTDNSYSVFNGNGDGTFTEVRGSPIPLPASAEGPIAMTAADFNGDGKTDLAIVNQTTNNVTILAGNGDGTFQEFPNSPMTVGNFPVAIASGTLTGSTGPALAVVNQKDDSITVLLGNGDGTFIKSSQSPLATGKNPTAVAIADFVQQSNGGIAVTNHDTGTVTIYVDLGSGLFTSALEPAVNSNPVAIVAADFANSTFPDIVVANNNNESGVAGQVTLLISPASVISNPAITQQPYPGSEYEDIGLKVKATPNLHQNNEVTLQFEFEIRALAGQNINGIPVITNRNLTQTVRLKEDETSLIGGLLDQNETRTISGLPGLSEIPGAGYAFGSRNKSLTDTEFLILVTPRKVRLPLHESRSIYAGTGDVGARGTVGVNAPLAPQPEPPPQENPPAQAPAPTPEPPTPLQPPQGQPPPEQPNENPPPPSATEPQAPQPQPPQQQPPPGS